MRESRTPGSVRAKAEWLSYSTTTCPTLPDRLSRPLSTVGLRSSDGRLVRTARSRFLAQFARTQEPRGTYLSLVAGLAPDRLMRALIVRPSRTAKRGRIMSHHDGEEILFILTGRIELHIGKRKEVLNPGDCVQFEIHHTARADR